MIFIYDIILNFNDKIYEFFNWEDEDQITYAKKVPVVRVSEKFLNDLIYKDLLFDKNVIDAICMKTEIYNENTKNILLVSDGNIVFGLMFKDGKVIKISRLLLDEEEEVLSVIDRLSIYDFKVKELGKRKESLLSFNRKSELLKKELENEFNKLYKSSNIKKLNLYLYELKNIISNDIDYVYHVLINSLSNELLKEHEKMYKIMKLSYQNK